MSPEGTTLDVLRVFCVQLEGDQQTKRFVMGAWHSRAPQETRHVSQPLIESDMRAELRHLGFADKVIESHIEKAKAFTTTTTSREWWSDYSRMFQK